MLIGIDVGGTFTDGVLFDNQQSRVVKTVKVPTRNEQLQSSLLAVLDALLPGQERGGIQRIVLSTTLVTNCWLPIPRATGADPDPRTGSAL
jgi:N-methylhydantoinase A/oxoprolinase/acetone carboxylase beta subunit